MQKMSSESMLQRGVTAVITMLVVAGCGGSGSDATAATSTSASATVASTSTAPSTPGVSTNTGATPKTATGVTPTASSSTGTSSGTTTTTATTTTQTILFEQPLVSGAGGNLVVPPATHTPPPKGVFSMVLWQPDRYTTNGLPVVTGWNAGSRTGFTPAAQLSAQLGFQHQSGTTTGQMEGETVGAYLNSQDLPPSTTDQKMMITPQFIFLAGSQPMPFASPQGVLHGALDLQVPTAEGPLAYVVCDLLFKDPSGVRISIGTKLFSNGGVGKAAGSGYDVPSNTYMLNSPLGVDQHYITKAANSATATGTPWSGFRHFEWSMSEAQFVSALQYLTATYPGKVTSTDPAHYVLAEIHLNAEFHTRGQAAQLGWSMNGMKLWTAP